MKHTAILFGTYGLSLVAAVLLISACGSPDKQVQGDRAVASVGSKLLVPSFEWRIASQQEMDSLYALSTGREVSVYGFVGFDPVTNQQVIYTTEPKKVNDEVACTLGHEVMHLALGNYHK